MPSTGRFWNPVSVTVRVTVTEKGLSEFMLDKRMREVSVGECVSDGWVFGCVSVSWMGEWVGGCVGVWVCVGVCGCVGV